LLTLCFSPNLINTSEVLGAYCGECRDRSVKCDMLPYPFAKILAPTRIIPDTQETDGVQASAGTAKIKHEDNEQEDEPAESRDYDHDNDSVNDDQYPELSTYDDEHDMSNNDDEAGVQEVADYHGTLPETAIYHYSKYVDDCTEHDAE
jgi:hypothetical protein